MNKINEIKEYINQHKNSRKISNLLKFYKEDFNIIFKNTNLQNQKLTLQAYSLINNLNQIPKCKNCKINDTNFISFNNGFEIFCSSKCKNDFNFNQEMILSLDNLKTILSNFYLKIEPPSYNNYIIKYNLLNSLIHYTNFLDKKSKKTERIYCVMNNIKSQPVCNHCLKNKTKYINFKIGYRDYCSVKCSSNSEIKKNAIIKTNLRKYGEFNISKVSEIQNKKIKTNLEKYGIDNPSKLPEIKEKIKKTKLFKYGQNVFKEISLKAEKTKKETIIDGKNLNKISAEKSVKTKFKLYNGIYKNYNSTILNNRLNFINKKIIKFKNKNIIPLFDKKEYTFVSEKYKWKCLKCNLEYEKTIDNGKIPYCPFCNKNFLTSNGEKELIYYLKTLNISVEKNNRKLISPQEIDILFSEKKIGIEYNGLYYHSYEKLIEKGFEKKDAINYHLNKSLLCFENNIKLIHIMEHEWKLKSNILKSIINNKLFKTELKINARDCIIKYLNKNSAEEFLNINHLEGFEESNIYLGLYLNKSLKYLNKNNLVSVMSFKKLSNNNYILNRFCSLLNYNVNGAASKLLNFFEKEYNPENVTSYSDNRIFFNTFFEKLGFEKLRTTKPNGFYFKNYKVYKMEEFDNKKIKNYFLNNNSLIKKYNKELTVYENMRLNGFRTFYDCGNIIYKKKYNNKI